MTNLKPQSISISILAILLCVMLSILVACNQDKKTTPKEGILSPVHLSEAELVKDFVFLLSQNKAKEAYKKYVVTYKEHLEIDTLIDGAQKDERTVKLMAKMFYDDNVKHLLRWEDVFADSTLSYVGFAKTDSLEQVGPYVFSEGYRLRFKSESGKEFDFRPFNSLIRQADGFKIWNVKDTHAQKLWED